MINYVFSFCIVLALINLLYEFTSKTFEKIINDIQKETNEWFNKEFIIILYFICSFLISPYIFLFETIPDIFIDILNFLRFIKYKRILRKRRKRVL